MTEEQCELIAAAIKRIRKRHGVLDDLTSELAAEFQAADPAFDAVRFMVACGYREELAPAGEARGAVPRRPAEATRAPWDSKTVLCAPKV